MHRLKFSDFHFHNGYEKFKILFSLNQFSGIQLIIKKVNKQTGDFILIKKTMGVHQLSSFIQNHVPDGYVDVSLEFECKIYKK